MPASPSDFLGGFYGQYAGAEPGRAIKTAMQGIKRGFVDPFTAAEEFAAKGAASGWRSGQIERGVRKIQRKPYGLESVSRYQSYDPLVTGTYEDLLGRSATPEEIQDMFSRASAARVSSSDPGAFQSFLTDQLMTSREGMSKIKTPEDIAWERQFGPMLINESGEYQRGLMPYNPSNVSMLIGNMLGTS